MKNRAIECAKSTSQKFILFFGFLSTYNYPAVIIIFIIFFQILLSMVYFVVTPVAYIPLTAKTLVLYLLPLFAVCYSIYTVKLHYSKYKKTGILWDLFSPTALLGVVFFLKVIYYYVGGVSADDYHFGELIVPFFEYKYYGEIPYKSVVPSHGLVDILGYIVSYYMLGDFGTYGGELFQCIVINYFALCVYIIISRLFPFYLSLLIGLIMSTNIYQTYIIVMLVIYTYCFNKKFEYFIAIYGILSFLFFLIVPSNGGIAIIATLPYVVYRTIKYLKFDFTYRKLLYLTALTICFLSLFLYYGDIYINAMSQLLYNGMANIYAYGTPIELYGEFLWKGPAFVVLPVMFLYLLKEYFNKNYQAVFICITVILITILQISYASGRMDNGARASYVSIPILVVIALFLYKAKNMKKELVVYSLFLFALIFCKPFNYSTTTTNKFHNITKPRIYRIMQAHNDFSVMAHPQNMNELQFVKSTLNKYNAVENDLLVLSNRGAMYYYLKQKMPITHMAFYNLGHPKQTYKSIDKLNGYYPKIVHLYSNIRHDGLPLSIRGNGLYRYLLLSNKYSVLYDNNTVLLALEENPTLQNGLNILDETIGQQNLGYLPNAWGGGD